MLARYIDYIRHDDGRHECTRCGTEYPNKSRFLNHRVGLIVTWCRLIRLGSWFGGKDEA